MNAGDTFFLANRGVDEHLWFVLSEPLKDAEHVVIANFTTWRADKDQSCIVGPGEHSFIKHKSCVSFGDARIVTNTLLDQQLAAGVLRPHDPLGSPLLAKIRQCAADSRHMKTAVWQVLEDQQD